METRYTTAPWRFVQPYCEVTTSPGFSLRAMDTVALCSNHFRPEGEVIANGMLIAAAPELLVACEEARTQLERYAREFAMHAEDPAIDTPTLPPDCRRVLNLLDDAITKAKI